MSRVSARYCITPCACSKDKKIGDPYCELGIFCSLFSLFTCYLSKDRFNDQEQVWVGLQNWIYSRKFDLTGHNIDLKSVWLKCEGIDTVANIR